MDPTQYRTEYVRLTTEMTAVDAVVRRLAAEIAAAEAQPAQGGGFPPAYGETKWLHTHQVEAHKKLNLERERLRTRKRYAVLEEFIGLAKRAFGSEEVVRLLKIAEDPYRIPDGGAQ